MYNFLNLGFEGYKRIAYKDLRNARLLSRALESTYFTVRLNYLSEQVCLSIVWSFLKQVLSDVHRPVKGAKSHGPNDIDNPEHYEPGLPVVAFKYVYDRYWQAFKQS